MAEAINAWSHIAIAAAIFKILNEEFMQYLMSDLHQRFIGSLNYNKPLAVGDIFRADNTKTYTVVSINDTRNKSKDVKSVTVIPVRETANTH
jgi:hypothetical protein